jgi:hypothetical protein
VTVFTIEAFMKDAHEMSYDNIAISRITVLWMCVTGQKQNTCISTYFQSRGQQMLMASYMKQGLPAPNLAVGKSTSKQRQTKDDFDKVSSSTAGLSWKMRKWRKGLNFKQQESLHSEAEQISEELPDPVFNQQQSLCSESEQMCEDLPVFKQLESLFLEFKQMSQELPVFKQLSHS